MPRIANAEIERLKREVLVERQVELAGVELKKSGKDKVGRCPFHEDSTASLVVTPSKNLWHCFGCGLGGGPIDWVMKRQGVSFRFGMRWSCCVLIHRSSRGLVSKPVSVTRLPKVSTPRRFQRKAW
jgi:hypothetical protein